MKKVSQPQLNKEQANRNQTREKGELSWTTLKIKYSRNMRQMFIGMCCNPIWTKEDKQQNMYKYTA